MTEYINKSKLYNAIASREEKYRSALLRERNYNTPTALKMQGSLNATTLIKNMVVLDYPAADLKPVVRGKWMSKDTGGAWRVDTCSVCKKDTTCVRYEPAYDYCPNCGADMREVNNDHID